MKKTPCETCDHVHPATRNQPPYKWLCLKFPRVEGLDPVAPTQGIVLQPYQRCSSINGVFCPLWQPRKTAPKTQSE